MIRIDAARDALRCTFFFCLSSLLFCRFSSRLAMRCCSASSFTLPPAGFSPVAPAEPAVCTLMFFLFSASFSFSWFNASNFSCFLFSTVCAIASATRGVENQKNQLRHSQEILITTYLDHQASNRILKIREH